MKKALLAAAALVALPVMAQAQAPSPGVYIGAEGGLNWLLNFTANTNNPVFPTVSVTPKTGWAVGGVIGYDFVGPRVELEGIYRNNTTNVGIPGTALNNQVGQLGIMANLYYDFMPASVITPYIGAGAGLGLVDSNSSLGSTVFAYQGIVGLGWNLDSQWRIALEGRYIGTTSPSLVVNGQTVTYNNNNLLAMVGAQEQLSDEEVRAIRLRHSDAGQRRTRSIDRGSACQRQFAEGRSSGVALATSANWLQRRLSHSRVGCSVRLQNQERV